MDRLPSSPRLRNALLAASLLLGVHPAMAQIPNKLLHTILAPPGFPESGSKLGWSVAIADGLAVVGAPYDDLGSLDTGVVKVFDTSTGALLYVIPHPIPLGASLFGSSVAISGTTLVVGAPSENTGKSDAGSAYVFDLGGPTPTVPVATFHNPDPDSYDHFSNSVAIHGTLVVIGASDDNTGFLDSGSAYVFDLSSDTPNVPLATLPNPEPSAYDHFGTSVAISGSRVVIGSLEKDRNNLYAGRAYVYDIAGTTPTIPAVIIQELPGTTDKRFGYSVAIDGPWVVVGAINDKTGSARAGRAFAYRLDGSTPDVPAIILSNPDPAAGDEFGSSVAVSGSRVIVGARYDDTSGPDAGRAYVFDLESATPALPLLVLDNPNPAPEARYGNAVAISGPRVLLGAPYDDTGSPDNGSAYLYELDGAVPAVPRTLSTAPGPAANDQFGRAVALSGTLLAVGAHYEDTGAENAGTVYVYDLAAGNPTRPFATLHNPDPAVNDFFGVGVAASGTRVIVACPSDDSGAFSSGCAYVYDLAGASPETPVVTLCSPFPTVNGRFASSVALFGALVVVGAPGENTGAERAGSVYVYDLDGGTPNVPARILHNPDPDKDDGFGYGIGISGTRIIVGAPQDHTEDYHAGTVYVFDLASTTPEIPMATLRDPFSPSTGGFGRRVAIDGTRFLLQGNGPPTGEFHEGCVYVYDLAGDTPETPVNILLNPEPANSDQFGSSLAICGSRIVVGVPSDKAIATYAGTAYVFDLESTAPGAPIATLRKSKPVADDRFAHSVAIDGDLLVAGAYLDDNFLYNGGAVYVFGIDPDDLDADGLPDGWELTYWTVKENHDPLDDHDHDGYCELLELALGLNPTVSDPGGLPAVFEEDGYLTVSLTKVAGVSYEVQTGGTLEVGTPDSFSAVSTTVLVDDVGTLKVRDNVPVGTPPGRYLRVQVTASP